MTVAWHEKEGVAGLPMVPAISECGLSIQKERDNMDSKKTEQVLKVILERYGAEIRSAQTCAKARAAVSDLLPEQNNPDEHLVLRNAMESDAFWIFFAGTSLTPDSARRTVAALKKERHMTDEDAKFIACCILAVHGENPDAYFSEKSRRLTEESGQAQQGERQSVPVADKAAQTATPNRGTRSGASAGAAGNTYIGKNIFANYFRGVEAVGGKLYFDAAGMTFKSHMFNVQTGETRIEYSRIRRVQKVNTMGLVPNGMAVFTDDGREHRFVINNRGKVIAFLESVIRPET